MIGVFINCIVFKTYKTIELKNFLFLSLFRWYFRKIKRIEAEKKLLLPENEHGAFLIRDSESRHNDYSLSGMKITQLIDLTLAMNKQRHKYCMHLVNFHIKCESFNRNFFYVKYFS